MSSIGVIGFNHTSVVVPDIDSVLPFFLEGLGYELRSHGPREPADIEAITGVSGANIEVAFVARQGHVLELIKYISPATSKVVGPTPNELGASHIAFDVANVKEAVAAAARYGFRLAGKGTVVRMGPNAGRTVVYIRDSAGLTIELMGG